MRQVSRDSESTSHGVMSTAGRPRTVAAVLALCLVCVVVYGSRGSLGLFVAPWQQQFGATRGAVALVSTVGFLVYAAGQPLGGRLVETFSGRRLVVAGLALCCLGFAGAAWADRLWVVIVFVGVVAAMGTGFSSLPVLSVLATNLVRSRDGLVFGLLGAAAAGGQVVVLPIAAAALKSSTAHSLLAIAALLAAGAIAMLVATRPRRDASTMDASERPTPLAELLAEPRFYALLVPFFICGYTTTGLIDTHLIAHAVDHHIEVTVASSAMATLAAFNVVGVLAAGALTDRVNRAHLLTLIYIARAGILLVLPALTSPTGLFVFAALFGVADFATIPPTTALTRRVFRKGGWAVALGIISAAHQVGSALGAYLGGWSVDHTGNYHAAFISAAVLLVLAAVATLPLARVHDQGVGPQPT